MAKKKHVEEVDEPSAAKQADDMAESLAKDEPLAAAFVDKFLSDEDALEEATNILQTLAKSTPAHMGTAHGIALIHAAVKWVAAYVPPEEPA